MDKEIYKKNMAAFHKRYDFLAEQIENKEYELTEGISIDIIDEDLLRVIKNREEVILGEHYTMGNAFYLQELLKATTDKINILVYEPCIEVVLKALEEIDITEVFENRPVALLVKTVNEEELIPVLRKWLTNETIKFFKSRIMPGYDKLFFEDAKEVLGIVKRTLLDIKVTQNTIAFFGNFYARNEIGNAKEILKSHTLNQLIGIIPNDRPAIIIAAGPSLQKNIQDLKEAKGRAFLIAVDTALKPLLKAGIVPDIFITVDGNKPVELFDREDAWKVPPKRLPYPHSEPECCRAPPNEPAQNSKLP